MKSKLHPRSPLFFSVALLATLPGCNVSRIDVSAYHGRTTTGIVYYLPKSEIQVEAKFNLWIAVPKPPEDKSAKPKPPEEYKAMLLPDETEPIKIALFTRANPRMAFLLEPHTSAWMSTPEMKIGLSDTALLTAVNAKFEDKKSTVAANTIGAIFSIAKLVKSAGATEPVTWTKTTVQYRLRAYLSAEEAIAGVADLFAGDMKQILDAQDPRIVAEYGRYKFTEVPGENKAYTPCSVTLTAHYTTSPAADSTAAMALFKSEKAAGVIYPVTNPGVATVQLGKGAILRQTLNVPDTAPLALVAMRGRHFTTRSDGVTFNAAGALTEYKMDTSSRADAISGALNTNLNTIATKLGEAEAARRTEETGSLTRERALAGARVELAILELKLQQAEIVLANASDADKPAKQIELLTLQKQRDQLLVSIDALTRGITLP